MVEQSRGVPATPAARGFGVATLISSAVREVRAHWPQALALWIAGFALAVGQRAVRDWGVATLPHPGLSPAWLGEALLRDVAAAILAALALRLFLVPGPRWWRPDRGFAACVALLTLASVALGAQGLLTIAAGRGSGLPELFGRQLLWAATAVLLFWVFVRLLLWPVGALLGDAKVTPRRSWSLMEGYVGGYVLAVIVINLPILLVSLLDAAAAIRSPQGFAAHPRLGFTVAASLLGPAAQILQLAMTAILYRARTGFGGDAALESTRR
jgi:hypothetical protein